MIICQVYQSYCQLFLCLFLISLWLISCSEEPVIISDSHEIILEEDEDHPLFSVNTFSVSPDGRLIALGNPQAGTIHVYHLATGEQERIIRGTPDLIDSVVLKAPVLPGGEDQREPRLRADLLDTDGEPYSDSELLTLLPSRFLFPLFTSNNDLWVLAKLSGIYTYRMNDSTRGQGMYPCTSLLHYQLKDNSVACYPSPRKLQGPWAQAQSPFFMTNKGKFILPVMDVMQENQYDSAIALVAVNPDWQDQNPIALLPKEHRQPSLGYSYLNMLATQTEEGDVLVMSTLIPRIYNVTQNTSLALQDIPQLNDRFYRVIDTIDQNVLRDSISSLLPLSLSHLSVSTAGTYMVAGLWNSATTNDSEWFVQEYDQQGKLLRSKSIQPLSTQEAISSVGYSPPHDAIVVLTIAEETGWKLKLIERTSIGEKS